MTTPAALNALRSLGLVPTAFDYAPVCRLGSGCTADGGDDLCGPHRSGGVAFDSSSDARVHVTHQVVEYIRAPGIVRAAYLTRAG